MIEENINKEFSKKYQYNSKYRKCKDKVFTQDFFLKIEKFNRSKYLNNKKIKKIILKSLRSTQFFVKSIKGSYEDLKKGSSPVLVKEEDFVKGIVKEKNIRSKKNEASINQFVSDYNSHFTNKNTQHSFEGLLNERSEDVDRKKNIKKRIGKEKNKKRILDRFKRKYVQVEAEEIIKRRSNKGNESKDNKKNSRIISSYNNHFSAKDIKFNPIYFSNNNSRISEKLKQIKMIDSKIELLKKEIDKLNRKKAELNFND